MEYFGALNQSQNPLIIRTQYIWFGRVRFLVEAGIIPAQNRKEKGCAFWQNEPSNQTAITSLN